MALPAPIEGSPETLEAIDYTPDRTAIGDAWTHRWSPRYVKHSVDDGRKVKIAAIDPDSCEASPLSLMEYAEWRLITCTHSLVL